MRVTSKLLLWQNTQREGENGKREAGSDGGEPKKEGRIKLVITRASRMGECGGVQRKGRLRTARKAGGEGMYRKRKPFLVTGLEWGSPNTLILEVWEAETACLVLRFS